VWAAVHRKRVPTRRRKKEGGENFMETFVAAMMSIKRFFEKKGVDGQALIEYALILVLIAVVVIVILTQLGQSVNTTFTTIDTAVQGANAGGS
jgi:pilus assembly protein Flp/PilA